MKLRDRDLRVIETGCLVKKNLHLAGGHKKENILSFGVFC